MFTIMIYVVMVLSLILQITFVIDAQKSRKKALKLFEDAQEKYEAAGKFLEDAQAINDNVKKNLREAADHLELVRTSTKVMDFRC